MSQIIDISEEALLEELMASSSGPKQGKTSRELANKVKHTESWVQKKLRRWKEEGRLVVFQYITEDLIGRPCKEYRYALTK